MNNRQKAVRAVLRRVAAKPFEYGVMDCMQFAAAVAHEITGVDYSAGFEYVGEGEANRIIRGSGSLRELVSEILGKSPVPVNELDIGDPVLMHIKRDLMGVMLGGDRVALKTEGAILPVSVCHAVCGWRL